MSSRVVTSCVLFAISSGLAVAQEAALPGWTLQGGGRSHYEVVRDGTVHHGGNASALLRVKDQPTGEYATLTQAFSARNYGCKRMKLSAYVKTEGATGRADFWARGMAVQAACRAPSD